MTRDIRFRELTESSEDTGTSVYEIRVQEELLGFLYLDPDSYTVSWKGSLDFHKLGNEAFDFLSLQTRPEKRFMFRHSRPEARVLVSFILSDEPPDLVEYNLDDPIQHKQYDNTLNDPNRISFARYDFQVQGSQFVYNCTFTAENPESTADQDSELAIQLPRPLPLSEESFKWIIDRHVSTRSLSDNLDLGRSVERLSDLVCSRSIHAVS